jgi:hypothetical protein
VSEDQPTNESLLRPSVPVHTDLVPFCIGLRNQGFWVEMEKKQRSVLPSATVVSL